jgi:His-Xaa-Ser system protein HxsD
LRATRHIPRTLPILRTRLIRPTRQAPTKVPSEEGKPLGDPRATHAIVEVDSRIVGVEALLKACYWFSREYSCDVRQVNADRSEVLMSPKLPMSEASLLAAKVSFLQTAMDFSLRERVDTKTAGIRDLLLAKAFSESGILEEEPLGVFGDAIEESKPDGMFKILSNPQS